MTTTTLVKKLNTYSPVKIGKKPVIVLPLELWEKIQDHLEDIEASNSKCLARHIAQGRKDIKAGKGIPLEDLL